MPKNLPLAVIDFETTGIESTNCHPVEMAIVHMDWGRSNPEVVYVQRFKPPVLIPESASLIHGIYDEDVRDYAPFDFYVDEIRRLLEGRVICAYNLAYDLPILSRYSGHAFKGICSLVLSRFIDRYARGKGVHRLVNTCARYGVSLENAHSAASDAYATAELLDIQLDLLSSRGKSFADFDSFWDWHSSFAREDEQSFIRYMKEKGYYDESRLYPWSEE